MVTRTPQGDAGTWGLAGDDAHAALMAATRSNLAIYPIDPTGLSPDAIPLETIGAFRAVAEVTGGFALINSNSFDETFERIVRENSTYYMLPDFSAEALAMSGVALVARNEPTVLTLRSSSKGGTGKPADGCAARGVRSRGDRSLERRGARRGKSANSDSCEMKAPDSELGPRPRDGPAKAGHYELPPLRSPEA